MRNWIFATLLLIMPMGALAQSDLLSGLGEEAKAQIMLEIAKAKANADGKATAEQINEYTEVGQNVAKAIIAVAGELGQTVDEVLKTMTGKLVVGLVIWKVAGKDLFGIFAGIVWTLIMVPAWMFYFRKFCVNYDLEYHENGKIRSRTRRSAGDNAVAIFIISALVIVGIGCLITFA